MWLNGPAADTASKVAETLTEAAPSRAIPPSDASRDLPRSAVPHAPFRIRSTAKACAAQSNAACDARPRARAHGRLCRRRGLCDPEVIATSSGAGCAAGSRVAATGRAGLNDVKEREIQGTRHRLQAPVLPEPQGFSLPSFEVKGRGRRCLTHEPILRSAVRRENSASHAVACHCAGPPLGPR